MPLCARLVSTEDQRATPTSALREQEDDQAAPLPSQASTAPIQDPAGTEWTLDYPRITIIGERDPCSCSSAGEVTYGLSARDCCSTRDCSHCRLRRMLEKWIILGSSPSLPDLWSCRLLRQLAQSPCHETFHAHDPSGDGLVRARRAMGLVLRRSDGAGRAGACRAVLAVVKEARCRREEETWPSWT